MRGIVVAQPLKEAPVAVGSGNNLAESEIAWRSAMLSRFPLLGAKQCIAYILFCSNYL